MKHRAVTEEPTSLDPRIKISHHVVTIVLGTEAKVDVQDLHHQGITIAHGREEVEDQSHQDMHTTMKTTK
jgi:hypothetical protein